MTTNTKPVDHVRLGTIQAAIWKNTDQEGRIRYGVTLERRYRDNEGVWQSSDSYGRDELLTLSKVADLANSRVHALQSEERDANRVAQATTERGRQR
ncbi:MAG: hypothetical protein AAGB48_08460 [Planctomycetota bacterium]